jgi:hypothetical protein
MPTAPVDAQSSDPNIAAVQGTQTGDGRTGVLGIGPANGVIGQSTGDGFSGVVGESKTGPGVSGSSTSSVGVDARTASGPAALRAIHAGEGLAGLFVGDVKVTRNLIVEGDLNCPNADFAEDFDVSGTQMMDAGTVMVLGSGGTLSESQIAYDHRVAGVISGAGDYRPGIVLDRRATGVNRQPVALIGKVFCKVDAQFGTIAVGDLLTTSPTPGHAMKTANPLKAFGAIIGKALSPHDAGQGLIPILVSLQ